MNTQMFIPAISYLVGMLFIRMATMGYLTPQQASEMTKMVMDFLTLGLVPFGLAAWSVWRNRPQALATRAAAEAPNETMNEMVAQQPQTVLDSTVNMDGVKAIVAEDRYANANNNENVITAKQAITRLTKEGKSS